MFEFIALNKSTTTLLKIGNVNISIEISFEFSPFSWQQWFLSEDLQSDFWGLLPGLEEDVNLKKGFKH